ncbi:MAG: hypothetical protein HZA89_09535 [Verrucomicrobia bacterium]|nr:hypothetical protein [Verrucomicrobiota bacterium]
MNYAVLQKSLEIPDVEKLKAAFAGIPGLTAADAAILAKDAFGVLVKGKSAEVAGKLSGTLRSQGIETLVVPESELPVLPPTKFLRRLECQPQGLIVYDAIGRPFTVDWRHISLIAAGSILVSEFARTRTESTSGNFGWGDAARMGANTAAMMMGAGIGIPLPGKNKPVTEFRSEEQRVHRPVLDIFLGRAVARYSVEIDTAPALLFQYLGARRTKDPLKDLTLIVQDLARFAPQAAVNRGAYLLRENAGELFAYPSKHAFHEEITWILWQFSRATQAGGTS